MSGAAVITPVLASGGGNNNDTSDTPTTGSMSVSTPPAASTSRLSASAKPFTFNPNAKVFVFEPAKPPPVKVRTRISYSTEDLFALQPPLYCGSSLILSPDSSLDDILLYDPCFDYISAGLVTAVPVQALDMGMTSTDGQCGVDENGAWRTATGETDGTATTTGSPHKRSPAKTKSKRPKRSAKQQPTTDGDNAAQDDTTSNQSTGGETNPDVGADTTTTAAGSTAGPLLIDVVTEGVRRTPPRSPRAEREEGEEREEEAGEESDEEYSGSEDEDDEGDMSESESEDDEDGTETGEGEQMHKHQPSSTAYMWMPQQYVYMPGAAATATMDDSSLRYHQTSQHPYAYYGQGSSTTDYYTNNGGTSYHHFNQEETSLHAGRRRQVQSEYFARFATPASSASFTSSSTSSSAAAGFNQYGVSRVGLNLGGSGAGTGATAGASHRGSTYSPPLMAQRRDLRYQQDLHLHLNETFLLPPRPRKPFDPLTHKQYDREKLLELRAQSICKVRPSNLPHYLSDIYKSASPPPASRSLFGNNSSNNNSPSSSSSTSSASVLSIFRTPLQANTNHSTPGPIDGAPSSAFSHSHLHAHGQPPKNGKSAKSRRKKNKDRSSRQMMDEDHMVLASKNGMVGRRRIDSMDQEEMDQEEMMVMNSSSSSRIRSIATPKHKKGKKGTSSAKPSQRSGSMMSNQNQHVDPSEFENVTLADLHHCENRWSASGMRAQADEVSITTQRVRSILNKLSVDTLDPLSESLLAMKISSPAVLGCVVDTLFEKSVDEPEFAPLYAMFAAKISERLPQFTVDIHDPASSGVEGGAVSADGSNKSYAFRTMLLTRCYNMLVEDEESMTTKLINAAKSKKHERNTSNNSAANPNSDTTAAAAVVDKPNLSCSPPLRPASSSPPPLSALELDEKLQLLKMHQKGNLQLIGELFKQDLLQRSVVHLCVDMLLEEMEEPSEWDVECVTTLLATVGSKLDEFEPDAEEEAGEDHMNQEGVEGETSQVSKSQSSKRQPSSGSSSHPTRAALVDSHFHKISLLSRSPSLASRFRFMLLDLLDLRARKWIPRIAKTVQPQSLAEIREESNSQHVPSTPFMNNKAGTFGALTTGKKKAAPFGHAPTSQHQHMRTTVRPAPSSRAHASSYHGKTLDFGSPMFQRTVSAPDRHDPLVAAAAFSPRFHHSPSSITSNSTSTSTSTPSNTTSITPGTYIPVWKRKQLGLEEEGKLKPRSGSAASTPTNAQLDGGAAHGDGQDGGENKDDQSSSSTPLEPVMEPPPAQSMSNEEMQHQLDVLVDELYSSHDTEEACTCVQELLSCCSSSKLLPMLVVTLLSKLVELRPVSRSFCTALLQQLFTRGHMDSKHLLDGLSEWMSFLPDISIDCPLAPATTHAIFAQLIKQEHVKVDAVFRTMLQKQPAAGDDSDGDDSSSINNDDQQQLALDLLSAIRSELSNDDDALVKLVCDEASPSATEADASNATATSSSSISSTLRSLSMDLFNSDAAILKQSLESKNLHCIAQAWNL